MPEMERMTKLINQLKIPCIIAGVGLRAPFEPDFSTGFAFDETVKEFMSAVLNKSAIVGVRGEITSNYLSKLGFIEGKHHTVIGCPSMYANGRKMTLKELDLSKESTVGINSSILSPKKVHEFLKKSENEFSDYYFFPQRIQELKLIYLGEQYVHGKNNNIYPTMLTDKEYAQDRVRYFLNAPEWIDFLKGMDFCFGGRMHGNIASILAGTPSLLISHDARTRELAEYHSIPHVKASEINKKSNIFDLVNKADFNKICNSHESKFDHFSNFLKMNGLKHIYSNDYSIENIPFDKLVEKKNIKTSIKTAALCTSKELAERKKEFDKECQKNKKGNGGILRKIAKKVISYVCLT